jgi:hypothetical protein
MALSIKNTAAAGFIFSPQHVYYSVKRPSESKDAWSESFRGKTFNFLLFAGIFDFTTMKMLIKYCKFQPRAECQFYEAFCNK